MKRRALLTVLTGATMLGGGCLNGQTGVEVPSDGAPDVQAVGCDAWTTLTVDPLAAPGLVETVTVSRTDVGTTDPTLRIPQLAAQIRHVLDGEPTTIDVERAPPLHPAPYIRQSGDVYTIDATITDTGSITGPAYRVTEASYREVRDVESIQYTELSNHDLWRLTEGIRAESDAFVVGSLDGTHRDESTLATGHDRLIVEFPDDIDHFGRYFELERVGTTSSTVDRIRYDSTHIGDPSAFETHFVHEHGIILEEPGDDVRTLLDAAIDVERLNVCAASEDTSDETVNSSTLETLKSQLQIADPMDEDARDRFSLRHDSKYYVRYEGTWYDIEWETGYV